MKTPKHLLIGIAVLGICGTALAQSTGQSSTGKKATDPFVERREEKAEAKKEYKSGKITKQQYDKERAEAKNKLKSTGERGTFEQNLDVPGASSPGK